MERRRLIYYLLLNIFVSACVTSAILFWYHRAYRAESLPVVPVAPMGTTIESTPNPGEQPRPPGQLPIEIVSMVGAGTLNVETVLIRYNGDGEMDLTGWRLKTEDENIYSFPQLKLYKNGAVQVHSSSGTDTVVDLYWGLNHPVWNSGDLVTLLDAHGNIQAIYRIP